MWILQSTVALSKRDRNIPNSVWTQSTAESASSLNEPLFLATRLNLIVKYIKDFSVKTIISYGHDFQHEAL